MTLRPWHVIVCVVTLAVVLIGCAYTAEERAKVSERMRKYWDSRRTTPDS